MGTDIPVGKGEEANTTPISMDTIASKRSNVQVNYKPLKLLDANATNYENYPNYISKTEKTDSEGKGTGEFEYALKQTAYVADPNADYTRSINVSSGTNINNYSELGYTNVLGNPPVDFKFI